MINHNASFAMTTLNEKDFKYTTRDGKHWTRKMFGFEATGTRFIDLGEGFTMYTGILTAHFGQTKTRAELEIPIRKAWIKARHLAPSIATRQVMHEDTGDYWHTYTVPSCTAEVEAWARQTIFWHDDLEPKTLFETYLIQGERWWTCSEGHFVFELHMFPSSETKGDWHISYISPHNGSDGRSLMKLMENILIWTLDELKRPTAGTPKLNWGEETIRLAPTMILAAELPLNKGQHPLELPKGVIPFLPPIIENPDLKPGDMTNVAAYLQFSEQKTMEYRLAGRKHGVTVTDMMLTLTALATVETELKIALKDGLSPQTREIHMTPYEQSTHFLVGIYFMNHRHKFPSAYKELENGALLLGTEGPSLLYDMSKIKEAIQFDRQEMKITRNSKVVWEVVKMCHEAARACPSDWDAIYQREVNRAFILDQGLHKNSDYHMRIPFQSSIGDYKTMDILNDFVPDKGALSGELTVTQQFHGCRITHPLMAPICWTYADRMNVSWATARKWQTQEELNLHVRIFEEWMDILIESAA
ncbi:hypothetical protein GYMLUDRAFT_261130 [Collybiopsis luxurians FD-317 M1]|uniref:Uncharacterized protein n=1 Tax=Collybiopsis luxurians FD-317 M1 TaxID=944289 RepID=A0A0D0BBZ5_9AGAR|nr:hypothetical protein GYMLUDRAFT_261130 [Collybiopsis luxurians FD-317 M1]